MDIKVKGMRSSFVPDAEPNRYVIYRLLLLSFEDVVKNGDIDFDEYLEIGKRKTEEIG